MSPFVAKVPSLLPQLQERIQCERSAIVTFEREFPRGHLIESHQHARAQLIYAVQGMMRIDTPLGIWVVPPMRAVWVPAGVEHEIRASTTLQLRTLFISPRPHHAAPEQCHVVEVSRLLRELILRLVELGPDVGSAPALAAMLDLLMFEINAFKALPLHVPMPVDARLLKICHRILEDPSNGKTCEQWGFEVGASSRTLERLFLRETSMSFGAWRRHVRLLTALDHLATGTPITNVALDLGYQSPSAFTAMFKRTLGRLPSEIYS